MPSVFGSGSSAFDQSVENATTDKNQEDDWAQIMEICDKVSGHKDGPRDVLRAIFKRANHRNQTVAAKSLILLDACVSNCGRKFASEMGSRDAVAELRKIANSSGKIAEKMRSLVKKWAEGGDLKSESNIVSLNNELKSGSTVYSTVTFGGEDSSSSSKPSGRSGSKSKPTAQELQEKEIEDLARAMALSMQEAQAKQQANPAPQTPQNTPAGSNANLASLYPAMAGAGSVGGSVSASTSVASTLNSNEPRKVRALYDFEAAEENELTFKTGDLIFVLDDSDANWWRGYTTATPSFAQNEGLLFPSNFVTSDLTFQPVPENTPAKQQGSDSSSKVTQASGTTGGQAGQPAPVDQAQVVIDEAKIDRGLGLIQAADPTGEQRPDSDELLRLEQECRFMVPLVDAELERVDGLHAKLTDANQALVDAFAEYHRMMAQEVSDKRQQLMSTMPQYGIPGGPQPQYYDPSSNPNFIPSYGVPGAPLPYYASPMPPPNGYASPAMNGSAGPGPVYAPVPPMNLAQMHPQIYGGYLPSSQTGAVQNVNQQGAPQQQQQGPPQPAQFQQHQMQGQV